MALSMGIEYTPQWLRICLIEDGQTIEAASFAETATALAYIVYTCAVYPELTLTLSADLCAEFASLQTLLDSTSPLQSTRASGDQQTQMAALHEFVQALSKINLKSYSLPSILYTPEVPRYRRLARRSPGSSRTLAALATLLHRLRARDADWFEMSFLYLELEPQGYQLAVVREGRLLDGLDWRPANQGTPACVRELLTEPQLLEQAFWEALSQDLASALHLHHLEDIVIAEHTSDGKRRDEVVDRLGDSYQCYLFPEQPGEAREFISAYGAALLAEGLHHTGPGAEITRRLLPTQYVAPDVIARH